MAVQEIGAYTNVPLTSNAFWSGYWGQRYVMVPRKASPAEIVKEGGEVVTGVLRCEKLVPNLVYL